MQIVQLLLSSVESKLALPMPTQRPAIFHIRLLRLAPLGDVHELIHVGDHHDDKVKDVPSFGEVPFEPKTNYLDDCLQRENCCEKVVYAL